MKIDLSPEERGYILGLLREHLEYYQTLVGNLKCAAKNRATYEFLETLCMKLRQTKSSPNGQSARTNVPFRA